MKSETPSNPDPEAEAFAGARRLDPRDDFGLEPVPNAPLPPRSLAEIRADIQRGVANREAMDLLEQEEREAVAREGQK